MIIAILADAKQKAEVLGKNTYASVKFIWPDSVSSLLMIEADIYFDLQFVMERERIDKLKSAFPKPVLIGAVNDTLEKIGDKRFIRINSWPGMIGREVIEAAYDDSRKSAMNEVESAMGWAFQRVPDVPGFVTARIIGSIINEAYFTLGEDVASKESIDLAMKLGTGYPYGPFEWAGNIGKANVLNLLKSLHLVNSRYEIAPFLEKEVKGDR